MNKVVAVLAVVFFASLAQAEEVYSWSSGAWVIKGHVDYSSYDNDACVLSTYWYDGGQINVNVFPKLDGSQNVTMTVSNPSWSFRTGDKFTTAVEFYSHKYESRSYTGIAQVKASDRLIFRRMNKNFSDSFIHYDTMRLFADSSDALDVDLTGTSATVGALQECIDTLLSGD